VLVEGPSKFALKQSAAETRSSGPIQLVGRSTCDRIVVFDGNPRLAGTLARISVHDCTATTLIGSIVTRELQHGSNSLLPILA
jgi:tRNA-2-methylthio-N6-dimethylallyladenosine synthase